MWRKTRTRKKRRKRRNGRRKVQASHANHHIPTMANDGRRCDQETKLTVNACEWNRTVDHCTSEEHLAGRIGTAGAQRSVHAKSRNRRTFIGTLDKRMRIQRRETVVQNS